MRDCHQRQHLSCLSTPELSVFTSFSANFSCFAIMTNAFLWGESFQHGIVGYPKIGKCRRHDSWFFRAPRCMCHSKEKLLEVQRCLAACICSSSLQSTTFMSLTLFSSWVFSMIMRDSLNLAIRFCLYNFCILPGTFGTNAKDGYGILISGDEMPIIEENILEINHLL